MPNDLYPPHGVSFSLGGPLTPAVKVLLLLTSSAFFLQTILQEMLGVYLEPLFGVVPYFVTHRLWLWQPFTYLFLHAGILHLSFNLLVLWMFGCELERVWGSRFFLRYYLVCGVGAGFCIALLSPAPVPLPSQAPLCTVGCSGALYGLLLAYGLLFPERRILLWFVLPIRARHFVWIIGALAFYSTLTQPGNHISHLAHLSGLLIGYLYLRGWGDIGKLRRWTLERKLRRLKQKYQVIQGRGGKGPPPYVN
jgi:membrane associated rhomboid family serine protease